MLDEIKFDDSSNPDEQKPHENSKANDPLARYPGQDDYIGEFIAYLLLLHPIVLLASS